jgi:hypothetical protein
MVQLFLNLKFKLPLNVDRSNIVRVHQPIGRIYPGFHPITGYYSPAPGWSGYSGIGGFTGASGFSGYSGHGVPMMNASVINVSSEGGNSAFLRLRIGFDPNAPTPAVVYLAPFNKSGICNWSVQPIGDGSTVTGVSSSLADASDLAWDYSNVGDLVWNTDAVITSGSRYFITGPVTMLMITGTGYCYVLGA